MQTHAMLCMCHYIVGIGDRHLSNFMVNVKTGEMVGIDFGHAFGSASQVSNYIRQVNEIHMFKFLKMCIQLSTCFIPFQE